MPQVPLGRFKVIREDVIDETIELLSSLPQINMPYARIGVLCNMLSAPGVFVVEDDQDIGLIPRQAGEASPDLPVEEEAPPEPADDDQALRVVSETETASGLPEAMKEAEK